MIRKLTKYTYLTKLHSLFLNYAKHKQIKKLNNEQND